MSEASFSCQYSTSTKDQMFQREGRSLSFANSTNLRPVAVPFTAAVFWRIGPGARYVAPRNNEKHSSPPNSLSAPS